MSSQALLAALVAFDTTSRESNLTLIEYIQRYLQGLQVESELILSDDGRKANLYARVGPAGPGGVMLSGHSDVVPVDGQQWTSPPFKLTEKEGRLYGRGTADMKGYLACVLAAVPYFLQQPLSMPLHLAISYDEEVGCLGVRSLVAALEQMADRPAICIVGEPTSMQPVLGHKGKLGMCCEVTGAACHSAYAPHGVNAIEYAAKLINRLNEIGERLRAPAGHDLRFDPPFTTVQTGVIRGGEALNIVPEHCRFDFEVRTLPRDNAQQIADELALYASETLLPIMQAKQATANIRFSPVSAYPGLASAADSPAAMLMATLCATTDFTTVAFGTEGGLFDQIGISTVVCGPGNIEQAHKPDEYITLAQLTACDAMLRRLAQWMCQ